MTVPSVEAPVIAGLVGTLVVALVLYWAVARDTSGFDAGGGSPAAGAGPGDEVVCPRCHHTTGSDSDRCPECGKHMH